MKFAIASAVSLAALAVVAASPAAAKDGPEVQIDHAVARVVVIVEDRADIGVEIEQGHSGLPAVVVHREGARVRIDGGLRGGGMFGGDRIRNCRSGPEGARQPGEGASVEVRGVGRVNLSDAPLIVVRTPRDVNLGAGGAVFGAVGRGATSIDLGSAGCGDWTVANTDGKLEVSLAGSGDIRAGTSGSLEVSLAGSGSVMAAATRDLDVSIAGSGDVTTAAVSGPVDVSIAGSGSVTVNGDAGAVSVSTMGSGDVNVRGTAASVDASIAGSGDVSVGRVTGSVSQSIAGSGDVTVGGQTYHQERGRNRH